MLSKDPVIRFEDIIENIARIEQYTAGMDLDTFARDTKTVDAVERCLSRISEAAVKLGIDSESLCPSLPWRDIRGLGNRLRHEYIDPETVIKTVCGRDVAVELIGTYLQRVLITASGAIFTYACLVFP